MNKGLKHFLLAAILLSGITSPLSSIPFVSADSDSFSASPQLLFSPLYPYRFGRSYSNFWIPYWLLYGKDEQTTRTRAEKAGFDYDSIKHPKKDMYYIIVEEEGEKKPILVTHAQYEKITVNDEIELSNGNLFLNGKLLSPE